MRICSICKAAKPSSEYNRNARTKDGLIKHCKTCHSRITKDWWAKNKDRPGMRAYRKTIRDKWRANNPDKVRATALRMREKHGKRYVQRNRERYKEQRQQAIMGYGGKCTCCGERNYRFLTFDHVNNDGNKHRLVVSPTALPAWIIKKKFPSLIQVLCFNCNLSKQFYGLPCIH